MIDATCVVRMRARVTEGRGVKPPPNPPFFGSWRCPLRPRQGTKEVEGVRGRSSLLPVFLPFSRDNQDSSPMALSALAPPRALLKTARSRRLLRRRHGEAKSRRSLSRHPRAMLSRILVLRERRRPRSAAFGGAAGGFGHAFQLPAGFLRALSAVRPGGRAHRLRLQEPAVHPMPSVALTYVFRPGCERVPALFAAALAARLAGGVLHSADGEFLARGDAVPAWPSPSCARRASRQPAGHGAGARGFFP